jgi:hypothetical protein
MGTDMNTRHTHGKDMNKDLDMNMDTDMDTGTDTKTYTNIDMDAGHMGHHLPTLMV